MSKRSYQCKLSVFCFLLGITFLIPSPGWAQNLITVKGSVIDNRTKEPLPGVSVKIKKTGKGVSTGAIGTYSIQALATDVLVFIYVGYETVEVPVNGKNLVNVSLKEEAKSLNEVVVIGYGEVAKKDLTGSVAQVNVQDVAIAPVMSFDQALAGRVAGVNVSSGDGQPGQEGINIVIRGAGSITQNTGPLYVIDGFPMEDFDANTINTEDIESMNILKDASATAIYGARGANGVVLIETKKGKVGVSTVTYSTNIGLQEVANQMEMMSPYDFVEYQIERLGDAAKIRYTPGGLPADHPSFNAEGNTLDSYKSIRGINWQDLVFQSGLTNIHNLSLTGGNTQTKYAISGSFFDQKGVIIETNANRVTGRVSLDQMINKKLKTGLNISYSNTKSVGQVASVNEGSSHAYGYLMYSIWGFRPITGRESIIVDIDEEFIDEERDEEAGIGTATTLNPVQALTNEDRQSKKINLNATGYLNFNINKNLTFRQTLGYQNLHSEGYNYYNSKTIKGSPLLSDRGVQSALSSGNRNSWNSASTLTYRKRFNKDHYITVMGGAEWQENIAEVYGYGSQLIPLESLGLSGMDDGVPNSQRITLSNNKLASFLGRASYDYKSKYLFTATYRADGSSKFSSENRWAYFPSGAFAWKIGNEKFMKNLDFISDAKLRTSIGMTGNNRVSDFAYLSTITGSDVSQSYSFKGGSPSKGMYPGVLGNKHLKWETTVQADLGLDLSLFKNRIEVTADVYRKTTTDLLLNASLPEMFGFSRSYRNIGKLENEGLELTFNTVNIKKKDFKWSTNFNISFNKNKILALTDDEPRMLSQATWDTQHNGAPLWVAQVGQPVALFMGYIWDGVYQYEDFDLVGGSYILKNNIPDNGNTTTQPGDIKYRDINGDGTVNGSDETIIGNPNPKHVGGFANNFEYKGFALNVFFQWSYGNEVFNANRIYFEGGRPQSARNQFATYADRWTDKNPSNTQFRNGGQGALGRYSSKNIEDASYLRLKTISLSYNLPKKWIKPLSVKGVALSATAQNLHTWTDYSGMDPEVSTQRAMGALTPGFDWSAYPRAKTIVFGIKATL